MVLGCSTRVKYQDAVLGCSTRVKYQDAVLGCSTNPALPYQRPHLGMGGGALGAAMPPVDVLLQPPKPPKAPFGSVFGDR